MPAAWHTVKIQVMKFRQICPFFIALTLALGAASNEANLEPEQTIKAPTKPTNPALVKVADVQGLPRVLLIGDSISMGYTLPVRKRLKGNANVHRPPENCGDTARGLAKLHKWLGNGHWDVIHFNFGLHDLKYLNDKGAYVDPGEGNQVAPPDVYRQRLRELTLRLKQTGAKLIFATTTPVPPGARGRVAGDEIKYNKIATDVMTELNVPIDDLCACVAEQQRQLPPRAANEKPAPGRRAAQRPGEIQRAFDVHFTAEGYEKLADLVVASIENALSTTTNKPPGLAN